MQSCAVERLPVMRDLAVGLADRGLQPRKLKRGDFVARRDLDWIKTVATRREVDAFEQETRHALSRPLDFPLRCVPVLFEICNQGRAEVAVGLLTAVNRHITAESIERFFPDPESAAVAGGTHHARGREIVAYLDDRLLHLIRRCDDIANHAALGAVAIESATHHDRLPCCPRANKTREAQVCGPRDNPLLARREC